MNWRCLKLYRAYSISFNSSNSKGLYQSSGKAKESCLAFTSLTKREMRNPLLFCRSCWRRRCRCFCSLVLTYIDKPAVADCALILPLPPPSLHQCSVCGYLKLLKAALKERIRNKGIEVSPGNGTRPGTPCTEGRRLTDRVNPWRIVKGMWFLFFFNSQFMVMNVKQLNQFEWPPLCHLSSKERKVENINANNLFTARNRMFWMLRALWLVVARDLYDYRHKVKASKKSLAEAVCK